MPNVRSFILRLVPRWWPAVAAAQRRLLLAVALITIVGAALPAAFIVCSAELVTELSRNADRQSSALIPLICALATLLALQQLVVLFRQAVVEAVGRRMDIILRRRFMMTLGRPIGIGHLEDPFVQDRVDLAQGLANRLAGPAGGLIGVVGRSHLIFGGLACGALLALSSPALALGLSALYFGLGLWLRRQYGGLISQLNMDLGTLRRSNYLRDLLLAPGADAETRVFGTGGTFARLQDASWRELMRQAWRARKVSWLSVACCAALLGGGQLLAFFELGQFWASGHLSLFRLIVGIQATLGMLQLAGVGEWDRMAQLGWRSVRALNEVEQYTNEIAPKSVTAAEAPIREIRFDEVSFCYPDGVEVLDKVSFTIPVGSSCAIVGRNGAGKSTLLKLLFRFYEPTGGEILADGKPIREFNPESWRASLSSVFQDFLRLPISLKDNILMGASGEYADETLRRVADQSGVSELARRLPGGYESILSRQLRGGTEVSDGEWQKIAIARGLFALAAGAVILALDEPTASMDLEAERGVYEAIISATERQTLILVSHRFATVRKADNIVVLDRGRIVEDGSHAELLSRRGQYATMYNAQASLVR